MKPRKTREERAALREAALRRYEAARTARLAAEQDTYQAAVRKREAELEAAVTATVSKLAQRGEPLRLPALSVAVLATTVYVIRGDLSTRPLGPLAGAAATFKEIEPGVVHSHHMSGLGDPSFSMPTSSTRKVRRATATVTAGGQVHTFSVEGVGVPAAQYQVELFNALARRAGA